MPVPCALGRRGTLAWTVARAILQAPHANIEPHRFIRLVLPTLEHPSTWARWWWCCWWSVSTGICAARPARLARWRWWRTDAVRADVAGAGGGDGGRGRGIVIPIHPSVPGSSRRPAAAAAAGLPWPLPLSTQRTVSRQQRARGLSWRGRGAGADDAAQVAI